MPRGGSVTWQIKQSNQTAQQNATYLRKPWAKLSPEERDKTDAKKRAGSKQGKQFVANTEKAKKAGKAARMYKQKGKK